MSEEDQVVESDSHDDNAAPSTAPEVEATATTEADTGATETPAEPKKEGGYQKRINQLTAKNRDAELRAQTAEGRVKELEANKPVAKTAELVAPDPDKFDTDQEYQTANAKFYADTALKATDDRLAVSNEETQRQEQQQLIQAKKTAFDEKVLSIRDNFENFEEVAYGNTQFMDMDLAEQIFDLDKGPEVAYHLGSHLDEAARIFALNPVQRARELTKLEFQVEALKPKKVSDAPDPITPLGNSEAVESDPDKMSADEWQKWRNKQVHG